MTTLDNGLKKLHREHMPQCYEVWENGLECLNFDGDGSDDLAESVIEETADEGWDQAASGQEYLGCGWGRPASSAIAGIEEQMGDLTITPGPLGSSGWDHGSVASIYGDNGDKEGTSYQRDWRDRKFIVCDHCITGVTSAKTLSPTVTARPAATFTRITCQSVLKASDGSYCRATSPPICPMAASEGAPGRVGVEWTSVQSEHAKQTISPT